MDRPRSATLKAETGKMTTKTVQDNQVPLLKAPLLPVCLPACSAFKEKGSSFSARPTELAAEC